MDSSSGSKGTIVLTGANGTVGSTLVSNIVSQPEFAAYHGIYTVRNAQSATALKAALTSGGTSSIPHSHDIVSLDLSSLAKVRETAATINTRVASGEIPPIRALILNAGYLEFTSQSWSEDGYDLAFASNYLGHWLLTLLILQSMDKMHGRVVVVTSESHEYGLSTLP